jgi:hypothetical protein
VLVFAAADRCMVGVRLVASPRGGGVGRQDRQARDLRPTPRRWTTGEVEDELARPARQVLAQQDLRDATSCGRSDYCGHQVRRANGRRSLSASTVSRMGGRDGRPTPVNRSTVRPGGSKATAAERTGGHRADLRRGQLHDAHPPCYTATLRIRVVTVNSNRLPSALLA